jgi:uncharacterized protein YjbI with pentapeptide repeats
MGSCQHSYPQHHDPCPHFVPDSSTLCIWHNPKVRKNDEYVPALLAQADRDNPGNLECFQLSSLFWPHAEFAGRNLRDSDLRDAILDRGNLVGANLAKANLRRASLKSADLTGANLAGADLRETNLSNANLSGADLSYASLSGTVLLGADLTGANLTGALITDFRWNRLTRFKDIKGLEPQASSKDNETQAFLAPLVLGAENTASSALDEPDLYGERTRIYTVSSTETRRVRRAKAWGNRKPIAIACAASLAAGVMIATLVSMSFGTHGSARADDKNSARDLDERQAKVYVEQIRSLQEQNTLSQDELSRAQELLGRQQGDLDQLRAAFVETQAEGLRLHDSDDRAAILAVELEDLHKQNDELAGQSARQERLSAILADGVKRLEAQIAKVTKERDANIANQQRISALATEVSELRPELERVTGERDKLARDNKKLLGELLAAQRDIERYLARVNGTTLQDYLVGDHSQVPLLPITANEPIALGGDYLITLRVTRGTAPQQVEAQVSIQRPAALANPDVTVILYDAQEHPLRRVSYSFPHEDNGLPFTTATSAVSCDQFPAYARVMVVSASGMVAESKSAADHGSMLK